MSKAKAMFLAAATFSLDISWTWEARISREVPPAVTTEDRRETRGERGMGREVPKELRDPRRSRVEGEILRLCMN
jgi:hypothetical protein